MKKKNIKIEIPVEPSLGWTGEIMDMPHQEFVNYCKGKILIDIGKGEFDSAIYFIISISAERGKKYYHEQLVKQGMK